MTNGRADSTIQTHYLLKQICLIFNPFQNIRF